MKKYCIAIACLIISYNLLAEDGYRLWLRYDRIDNPAVLQQYNKAITGITINESSPSMSAAKEELVNGLQGLLGKTITLQKNNSANTIIAGTINGYPALRSMIDTKLLSDAGNEGFIIRTVQSTGKKNIVVAANTATGVLYGVFELLRLLQTQQDISNLSIKRVPKIQCRILDHWDNLNRTVERGYAGFSIWNWHTLPGYLDQRYKDYARANASIGINGVVLTNVNANALILTQEYLVKVAALANVFRPYGIKVYLTARFSAPAETGGLKTADPLDQQVRDWWKQKTDEIYSYIPDFGGFLVKANSEGQPGPQNYNRTHADGANMLADALLPHKGIVLWRAFVYSNETPDDRFKQAYNEFKPLDGRFNSNVVVQVKNGPIDFQPREPFHPLFGAMPKTPLAAEFQLTQEYLGFSTHLVYLAPLFKECLDADTYANGKNTTVAKVVDGSLDKHTLSAIAGVANIGNDRNWCGHPFAQSNWYAFGRLAWDHDLSAAAIAEEWIRQTFSNNAGFVASVKKMMLSSREITVNYMTPLGLHHIMGNSHHYGPAPWSNKSKRADWDPIYYHKADSAGIGFDRTEKGSNALAQYTPEVRKQYEDSTACPDDYLLWFHHVSWMHTMHSKRTLWNELCYRYYTAADAVRGMQQAWNGTEKYIDKERFEQVKMFLAIQQQEAVWWRNACLLFFQTYSGLPLPDGYEKPDHTLQYYQALRFPFAPGI